jgi:hypothetical protein
MHRTPQNATSGRDKPACCRERCLAANHPFPPDPEASTVTIFKQHPYRRYRLTGADGSVTGIYLKTRHEGGGSHGRAGAPQTWLDMNEGQARTINLRK